jgi:hypothetical protein
MFAGPSGIGKTTLAKFVERIGGGDEPTWQFISGSVSDLLPNTKDELHKDMLSHDKKELYTQDFQILNLRKKLFANQDSFVSDRSFLDSAAYFLYKQADTIPQCEMDHFLELCKMCLCQYCDKLIVLNFTPYMVENWVMEDNNKRIMNKYFQAEISSIMLMILENWGVVFSNQVNVDSVNIFKSETYVYGGYKLGNLESIYGDIDIVIINEPSLDIRERIVSKQLGVKMVWPKRK